MAVKRGEIYFVDLNPVKGKEQAGNRPVLVLSTIIHCGFREKQIKISKNELSRYKT